MFIVATDRGGNKTFVARFDFEFSRDIVRKLVQQGRDFGIHRTGDVVDIYAKHEPEKTDKWWNDRIETFHQHERRRY